MSCSFPAKPNLVRHGEVRHRIPAFKICEIETGLVVSKQHAVGTDAAAIHDQVLVS